MFRLFDDRQLTPKAALLALAIAVRAAGQGVPGAANGGAAGGRRSSGLLRGGWSAAIASIVLLIGLFPVLGCGGERTAGGPPNIILISIDTLRADRLSLDGRQPPSSPRIDSWARRSAVTFRAAVAQAPWTLPSHCSMLTGLDPLHHGVNHPFEAAPDELVTLAERLSREGYYTAGITGGGWLHPRYGLADGYDRYRYWTGEQRGDEELAAHAEIAADWLEELREPFFLFPCTTSTPRDEWTRWEPKTRPHTRRATTTGP